MNYTNICSKSKEEKEKALSSLDDYKFYVKSFVTEKDWLWK